MTGIRQRALPLVMLVILAGALIRTGSRAAAVAPAVALEACTFTGGCAVAPFQSLPYGQLVGFRGDVVDPVQPSVVVTVVDVDTQLDLDPTATPPWSSAHAYTAMIIQTAPGQYHWTVTLGVTVPSAQLLVTASVNDQSGTRQRSLRMSIGSGLTGAAAYVSILFGRTVWQQYDDLACTRPTYVDGADRALSLLDVANEMRSVHAVYPQVPALIGVGNLVADRTASGATRTCVPEDANPTNFGNTYPSWSDVALLRGTYGWRFDSAGRTYPNGKTTGIDQISYPTTDLLGGQVLDKNDEVCGSVGALLATGILSGSEVQGMFSYPDNRFTDDDQLGSNQSPDFATGTRGCFDFGRVYRDQVNIMERHGVTAPRLSGLPATFWYAKTWSVNGGSCTNPDPAAPCHTFDPVNLDGRPYQSRDILRSFVGVNPGQWAAMQFYRLVTGSRTSGTSPLWDCTDPNPVNHWTSDSELYCNQDFLAVLAAIPPAAVVTDPATVAAAWGRAPG